MKILVVNTVLLNMGDAAIFEGLMRTMHKAFGGDIEVTVYDRDHKSASELYPNYQFRSMLYNSMRNGLRWLKPIRRLPFGTRLHSMLNEARFRIGAMLLLRRLSSPLGRSLLSSEEYQDLYSYRNADLIVSTGGTYLVENYSLVPRVFDFKIAMLYNRRLVFFTQSLGPFEKEWNRIQMRRVLNYASLVLLRDERSANHVKDIEVESDRVVVAGDGAFMLYQSSGDRNHNLIRSRVAISVREWRHFKGCSPEKGMSAYIDAVRDLVCHLVLERKVEVHFVSTCQGVPGYRYDDSLIAKEIVRLLPDDVGRSVSVSTDFHTPSEFLRLVQGFDLVVATRMHAAILSLCAEVPVLPIEYEFKTRQLFRAMGCEEYVCDINRLSDGRLIRTADLMLSTLDKVSARQMESTSKMMIRAHRAVDALAHLGR